MIRFRYKMTCFVVIMHTTRAEASPFVVLCGYFVAVTNSGSGAPVASDGRNAGPNRGH